MPAAPGIGWQSAAEPTGQEDRQRHWVGGLPRTAGQTAQALLPKVGVRREPQSRRPLSRRAHGLDAERLVEDHSECLREQFVEGGKEIIERHGTVPKRVFPQADRAEGIRGAEVPVNDEPGFGNDWADLLFLQFLQARRRQVGHDHHWIGVRRGRVVSQQAGCCV